MGEENDSREREEGYRERGEGYRKREREGIERRKTDSHTEQ